jgi:hypothetical protein
LAKVHYLSIIKLKNMKQTPGFCKQTFWAVGLCCIWALCFVTPLRAQYLIERSERYTRLLELGIGGNAYMGDLSSRYDFWSPHVAVAVHFTKKTRWNSSLNLFVGSMRSENYAYQSTEPSVRSVKAFVTAFQSLQYRVLFNFIAKRHFQAYLQLGIGLLRYDPRDLEGNSLADQLDTRLPGEEYGTTAVAFPFGFGLRYLFNNGWAVHSELSWWNPTTDYLDNIGQLGERTGNDNMLTFRFGLCVPLKKEAALKLFPLPPVSEPVYAR